MLLGVLFFAYWIEQITERRWAAWIAGAVAFVLLALVFGPALEALQELSCRGVSDYEACIEGD